MTAMTAMTMRVRMITMITMITMIQLTRARSVRRSVLCAVSVAGCFERFFARHPAHRRIDWPGSLVLWFFAGGPLTARADQTVGSLALIHRVVYSHIIVQSLVHIRVVRRSAKVCEGLRRSALRFFPCPPELFVGEYTYTQNSP